ncbi:MAG TPA: hypothetical protein DD982_12470, partial [Thalassospira sp.]|nr:hypothetical protein [Thalassospira sp.]
GGAGNDTYTGGAGSDQIIVSDNSGDKVVTDFNRASDQINLSALDVDNWAELRSLMSEVNGNTVINLNGQGTLTLLGVAISDLNANMFVGVEASTGPTPYDDVLYGTSNNDTIAALAGDDTVFGLNGQDTLSGMDGNDSLYGG